MRKIYLFLLALCVSSVAATVKAQTYPPTNQDTYGYEVLDAILNARLTTATDDPSTRFCKAIPLTPMVGETKYGGKQSLQFNVGIKFVVENGAITEDNRGNYPSYNNLSVLKAQGFVTEDEFHFKVGQTLSPKPAKGEDLYGFKDGAWEGSWMPYAVYIDYPIDNAFTVADLVSSKAPTNNGSVSYYDPAAFRAPTEPGKYRLRLMTGATTPPEGVASMATTGGNMIADAYITLERPTVTFVYDASRGTVTGGTSAEALVCGENYTFTVTPKSGYDATVTATVGDGTVKVKFTPTDNGDGTYTIAADKFQNDMTINVTFAKQPTFTAADAAAGNCYFRLLNKYYAGRYLKAGIAHIPAGVTTDRLTDGAATLFTHTLEEGSASYIWRLNPISGKSTFYLTTQGYLAGEIMNGDSREGANQTVRMSKTTGSEVTVALRDGYYVFSNASNGAYAYLHSTDYGESRSDAGFPATAEGNYVVGWSATTSDGPSFWTIEPVEEFNITIGKGGWSTIKYAFPVSLPASVVKAYAVSGETESAVSLAEVEPVGGEIQLPSNTPVFLEGTEGAACTVSILTSEPSAISVTNVLSGTLLSESPTGTIYGIATPSGQPTALYKMQSGTTIPCNKAYLVRSQSSVAKLDLDFGGTTTGIDSLTPNPTTVDSNVLYDLNGRRVLYPTRGIYVTGSGKKIYLK